MHGEVRQRGSRRMQFCQDVLRLMGVSALIRSGGHDRQVACRGSLATPGGPDSSGRRRFTRDLRGSSPPAQTSGRMERGSLVILGLGCRTRSAGSAGSEGSAVATGAAESEVTVELKRLRRENKSFGRNGTS